MHCNLNWELKLVSCKHRLQASDLAGEKKRISQFLAASFIENKHYGTTERCRLQNACAEHTQRFIKTKIRSNAESSWCHPVCYIREWKTGSICFTACVQKLSIAERCSSAWRWTANNAFGNRHHGVSVKFISLETGRTRWNNCRNHSFQFATRVMNNCYIKSDHKIQFVARNAYRHRSMPISCMWQIDISTCWLLVSRI